MFKFGVNTVEEELASINDYSVEVYKKCLDRIQKYGFEYVEYSHVHHLSLEEAKEIGKYAADLGLISHSVHNEGSIYKYGEENYYDIQNKCMENAKALGCGIIVFHLPMIDLLVEGNIEHVKKFTIMAGTHGLKAALENGPVDTILEIIKTLDMPDLFFALDTGHAFKDKYSITKSIKLAGEKLIHTHIADNFGISDDHLPPGMGLIQWQDAIDGLKAINYSGVLMVELTSCSMKSKRSMESLRNFPLESEMEIALKSLCQLTKRNI